MQLSNSVINKCILKRKIKRKRYKNMEKITVGVDGMMCGHCEAHVNDAVRNALKVKKVTSSHSKKETVIIAEEGLTDEQIKSTIDATGYTVTGINREPYVKKGLFGF